MVRKITKYEIIKIFINNYGKRVYLRELAKLLEKPHQTIKPYLKELVKERVLMEIKRDNLLEYELNFKNEQIYNYLVIAEKENLIKRLNEEPLLKILFEKLNSYFGKGTFILFGSSVEKVKKNSDLDLLIIGKLDIKEPLKEFEEIYNKKIHKVQLDNLENLSETLKKEVYKKHLILNDTENVLRFFGSSYEKDNLV